MSTQATHGLEGVPHTHTRTHWRANMAHMRQSRPDSGLGVQVKVLEAFQVVPSLLGSGTGG